MSRRKTLLANEMPSFEADVVDDEAEKRRRISERFENPVNSARMNKRHHENVKDSVSTPQSGNKRYSHVNGISSIQNQLPKPSNEQLSCLYNNCVKLLNENKINAKNAFQLKLIDYMSDIVLNKDIVGGVTNFQVVGCTIDAGTKIYAARVDALHHNTYQMLSGLGHSVPDEEETNNVENVRDEQDYSKNGEDVDDDNQQSKKAKNKKRRLKKSSQIAENLDTITSKLRDEFVDEDLYFGKISTCIEHEGISGLLLNKLHLADDYLKMLINPSDKISISSNHYNYKEKEQVTEIDNDINLNELYERCTKRSSDFKDMKLCVELSSFKFIGWNLNSSDEISKLVESMTSEYNREVDDLEMHRFDANNLQMSLLNMTSQVVDSNDLDGDIENFGSATNSDDFIQSDGLINSNDIHPNQTALQIFDKIDDIRSLNTVAELTTLITHKASDYSYFNFDKLRLHDLPKHLKIVASRLAAENNENVHKTAAISKAANARNKREMPRIDLSVMTDRMRFFRITKKAIYLCDRTIEKRSEKPSRIETERQFDYNGRELLQPYWKAIPAKVFSDIEPVENLLGGDDLVSKSSIKNSNHIVENDDIMGELGDDFEIPCSAQTNEPFYSQNGGEFVQTPDECPNMLLNGSHLIDDLANENNFNEIAVSQMPYDGDNLVQMPLQVNALNIDYAKTSKNIDVRRLKLVMWNLICTSNEKENINSLNDSSHPEISINKTLSSSMRQDMHVSLKSLYEQLKPPVISKRVYDDLSICIVFQMLLFLANEHGLFLKNDLIGSDVIITSVQ